MPSPRLLVLGHAAHDLVYRVPVIPRHPVKVLATDFYECGGGMAANAAVAIARLGGRASFWGRVADDPLGHRILSDLAAEGIDVSGARRVPHARSPVSSILVDEGGDRLICSFSEPTLDADPGWLPLAQVPAFDVVLTDVRWPAGAECVLRAARRASRPALLDADVAKEGVIERLAAEATHVLFSEVGLETAAPGLAPGAALQRMQLPHHAVIGVTLGSQGFLWREGASERTCAPPAVRPVDTLAAGDVWHGAFALATAEGQTTAAAAAFANRAAALKCTRPGGRRAAPTRAELDAWTA